MTDIATLPDALRNALPADVDLTQCEITTCEQGLESIRYEEADERSLGWIAKCSQ